MFFKLYLLTLPIYFVIDMLWIGIIAKSFYAKQIGYLMRPDINWGAAITFYLLFIIGIVLFVVEPALEKSSWIHALLFGALLGLVSYSAYDLTNLATIKDWSLLMTVVDMAWGTILSSSVSVIVYFIAKNLVYK